MFQRSMAAALATCLLLGSSLASPAFAAAGGRDADKKAGAEEFKLPPFPTDKSLRQSAVVDGRKIGYDATVGSLPVLDEKGKTIADVMFIAYTVPGANRPVTFALNGGPGASSVYLNLGAHRSQARAVRRRGRQPVRPGHADRQSGHLARLHRPRVHRSGRHRLQPRARAGEDEAKKRFYNPKADIEYLSRIIFDWLVKNERLTRASTWSAKATAASAVRASRITCRPGSAWR